MAVVVFDADVLIGFLNGSDAHHHDAVAEMRSAFAPGTRRLVSAVNYSEIMIGPIRAGRAARDHVDDMLGRFAVEIITVDKALANRAAAVRERTGLKLPDAFALATAIHAEHRGHADVRLASFDEAVNRAHGQLHPQTP
jgi:predicted nucleic acid-binding protein